MSGPPLKIERKRLVQKLQKTSTRRRILAVALRLNWEQVGLCFPQRKDREQRADHTQRTTTSFPNWPPGKQVLSALGWNGLSVREREGEREVGGGWKRRDIMSTPVFCLDRQLNWRHTGQLQDELNMQQQKGRNKLVSIQWSIYTSSRYKLSFGVAGPLMHGVITIFAVPFMLKLMPCSLPKETKIV